MTKATTNASSNNITMPVGGISNNVPRIPLEIFKAGVRVITTESNTENTLGMMAESWARRDIVEDSTTPIPWFTVAVSVAAVGRIIPIP